LWTAVMSELRGGDLVECVDDVPRRVESQAMPVLGQLYTVASIRTVEDGQSVRLKELAPSCYSGGRCGCGDCGWDARRFRRILRPDGRLLATLLEDLRTPA
jgi:hypothetical protein